MDVPHSKFEKPYWDAGQIVAGVDEVGRGPLAGPVVAAAVILKPGDIPGGLRDSKTLSKARLKVLAEQIQAQGQVGIGMATVEEIDQINILQASFVAMRRAVGALTTVPDHLLIDGNRLPDNLPCAATAIVKGDRHSLSIAAASIVAKTWRDDLMTALAAEFPGYGWDRNAGYPTKCHKDALQNIGVTPHHRRSFKPVRDILWQVKNASN